MKATEVITRVYRGERDFANVDLSGVSIPDVRLENCDFTKANLRNGAFLGTQVLNCDFSNAAMEGFRIPRPIVIDQSRFISADLRGSVLRNTQFSRVDLRDALFDHARLDGVLFQRTDLRSASFCDAYWHDVLCIESIADGLDIAGAIFIDSDIAELAGALDVRFAGRPAVVDWRTVCRSLRAPTLDAFLLSCDMPWVFVTFLIDCANAMDPKMIMGMLYSTFISYGTPDEPFARRLRDELQRIGVKTFFFARMPFQASVSMTLCVKV